MTTNDQFFYSLRYFCPFQMILRSLTIHFLTSSNKKFQLKAISPTSFQQWVDKIQQCQHHQLEHLSISIPINLLPGECTNSIPIYEFLANYSPSQTRIRMTITLLLLLSGLDCSISKERTIPRRVHPLSNKNMSLQRVAVNQCLKQIKNRFPLIVY